MTPIVLGETDLRRLCPIDIEALAVVENAFRLYAEGKADTPPVMHISVPDEGDIDVKGAYIHGLENLTVKLGSGFFRNPQRGLPSSSSIMVVMSASTGLCEVVLLENGYLTNLRTGLAGAVAAKHLARPDVSSVAVIGAGAQARFQIECLQLVRPVRTVRVWSRNGESAALLACELGDRLGIEAIACATAEDAVRESDIVVTTTPAVVPIVEAKWLREGAHITAVGSDTSKKQELAADCIGRARIIVCDSIAQCSIMGELRSALAQRVICPDDALELGAIVAGAVKVERDERDISVCDLTGLGVQDAAIAWHAMRRHRAKQ